MEEILPSSLPHPAAEDADAPEFKSRQDILLEEIKNASNFEGNWSKVFYQRLLHPITVERYVESRILRKRFNGTDDEFDTIKNQYLASISKVFNHTNYGIASSFKDEYGDGYMPQNKGVGKYHEPATVFSDAVTHKGELMSEHQKSIIEAHEQAHGVLDLMSDDQKRFLISLVDDYYISGYKTKTQAAQEILAKISQIKNYFGMVGDEIITEMHIDYAAQHYINDTNLNNSIGAFLKSIKPERKGDMIRFMNMAAC